MNAAWPNLGEAPRAVCSTAHRRTGGRADARPQLRGGRMRGRSGVHGPSGHRAKQRPGACSDRHREGAPEGNAPGPVPDPGTTDLR